MNKLLKLLDTCRFGKVIGNVDLDALIDCQPFVILHDGTDTVHDSDSGDRVKPDCLPFKIFSIEFSNGEPVLKLPYKGPQKEDHLFSVSCIVFIEESPDEYSWILLKDNESGYAVLTGDGLSVEMPVIKNTIDPTIHHILNLFLSELSTYQVGSIGIKERFKYRDSKGVKNTKTFNQVIVLRNKNKSDASISFNGIQPDWNHRWSVRGHWRVSEGKVGKDRDGNYCIDGYTWVKDHIRGPDDAPIVMKQRIMK